MFDECGNPLTAQRLHEERFLRLFDGVRRRAARTSHASHWSCLSFVIDARQAGISNENACLTTARRIEVETVVATSSTWKGD